MIELTYSLGFARQFWVVACFFLVVACASPLVSVHQRYIDGINDELLGSPHISDLEYNPDYPNGYFLADERYFTSKEPVDNNYTKYHYARHTLGKRYCHYHLLVDVRTSQVVGWGFDYELSDPTKECWKAG